MKATWQNTAIIIPIYNAASHLEELFGRIFQMNKTADIIAVNDGSADKSSDICKNTNVDLVDFKRNCGKGKALQIGFNRALAKGMKFAISLDSDLQHRPEKIPEFLSVQNRLNADMIIGKRNFTLSNMPLSRIMSNFLTTKIVSAVIGQKIFDSQSGYRLYHLSLIKKMEFESKRFQFETEILLKFAKHRAKFGFVNIETIYGNEKSNISHWRDIKNFVEIVLKNKKRTNYENFTYE